MKILYNLLLMSISGSLMFALSTLLHRQTRQRFAGLYYPLLVTAAAMFVVPLQALFPSHKMFKVTVPASDTVISGGAPYSAPQAGGLSIYPSRLIIALWAAISVTLILITAFKYFKISRTLKILSGECRNERVLETFAEVKSNMRIYREIELRTSRTLNSPLLFGVVKPIIIVPERDFTHDELVMIFTHELTHHRHCDLAIKLMASVSRCIHFFNPVVYFLSRAINEGCELCCDESVLNRLNLPDKKDYGRLIISMIETPDRAMAYSTAMASPKDKIQKRLLKIIEFRSPSKFLKLVSVMIVAAASLCSLTALGFEAAKDALPKDVTETIESILKDPAANTEKPLLTPPAQTAAPPAPSPAVQTPPPTQIPVSAYSAPTTDIRPVTDVRPADGARSITAVKSAEAATQEPEEAQNTAAAIEMPGASYVFNPVFSEDAAEVRSDTVSVIYDMFASIVRTNGDRDCALKVYRINNNGAEELVYSDDGSADSDRYSLSIRFLAGEKFYIIARQNNGAKRANIYVRAK